MLWEIAQHLAQAAHIMADEQQTQQQEQVIITQDLGGGDMVSSFGGDIPQGTSLLDEVQAIPPDLSERNTEEEEEVDNISNNHNVRLILAIIFTFISAILLWAILR